MSRKEDLDIAAKNATEAVKAARAAEAQATKVAVQKAFRENGLDPTIVDQIAPWGTLETVFAGFYLTFPEQGGSQPQLRYYFPKGNLILGRVEHGGQQWTPTIERNGFKDLSIETRADEQFGEAVVGALRFESADHAVWVKEGRWWHRDVIGQAVPY